MRNDEQETSEVRITGFDAVTRFSAGAVSSASIEAALKELHPIEVMLEIQKIQNAKRAARHYCLPRLQKHSAELRTAV